MLWYKAWLETRWRFLIGLAVIGASAVGTVLAYPQFVRLLPLAHQIDVGGELGRRIVENAALASTFRGYVWSQWFLQNMPRDWTIFAALLGSGGLLAQVTGRGGLFTLSLPASRTRLLAIRAATALAELFVLAMVPALLIPLAAPAVGQAYSVADALVHGLVLFVAGSVFFSLAFYCSAVFSDIWTPAVVALCAAFVMSFAARVLPRLDALLPYEAMSAHTYFLGRGLPWPGLLVGAAASAALLYGASIAIARRDF